MSGNSRCWGLTVLETPTFYQFFQEKFKIFENTGFITELIPLPQVNEVYTFSNVHGLGEAIEQKHFTPLWYLQEKKNNFFLLNNHKMAHHTMWAAGHWWTDLS